MRPIRVIGLALLAGAVLGACTSTPSPEPTTASSAGPTEVASAAATPAPTAAVTPAATACDPASQGVTPPSDRLTGVAIEPGPNADVVRFSFDTGSGTGTTPSGMLTVVNPPFTMSGSGLPVTVDGDRHVELRFEGMYLVDAQGNPSFTGPVDIKGDGAAAEVVNIDQSEGYIVWIVGIRGAGCVTVLTPPGPTGEVDLSIAH